MNDQDKRAVEGMARCGIELEGLCKAFPKFPIDEIEKIYLQVRKSTGIGSAEHDIEAVICYKNVTF